MSLPAYVDIYGAIVFPNNICIDGHHNGCLYRVVTHIHADHTIHIDRSITASKYIIASPITLEMLLALGYNIPKPKSFKLNYDEIIDFYDGSKLRFVKAEHIPGTTQVLYEDKDIVVAYTSDFKSPGRGTEIIADADVLVIDATYGDPRFSRAGEDVIWSEFIKLVRKLMSMGPIALYAYYGKAQDVMVRLRMEGIDAPFILSPAHWKLYRVLSRFGYEINDVFLSGSAEASEIERTGWYIEVHHTSKFNSLKRVYGLKHIFLTGRYIKTIMSRDSGNTWIVGISGHADFNELIYYVDNARPRLLVVDGYRSEYAHRFSSYVRENMGIESIVTPMIVSLSF